MSSFLTEKNVGYSKAPANADRIANNSANYFTENKIGDRALPETCMHIKEKIFIN